MLDFTSALYLDMHHPHAALRPWTQLTIGRPAALARTPGSEAVAHDLAHLLGCERAVLGSSTLHIFWDLFHVLKAEGICIYLDEGTYPIVRWGVERVAAQGVPVVGFRKHDPLALQQLLERNRHRTLRPVVVCDGICPASGRPAPLDRYLSLVRAEGGYLVIDDTQALGIMGAQASQEAPYGWGGSGTPAWHGIKGSELIVGSSLAKGFGVPVAVLAGSSTVLKRFEDQSLTSVHCSPPSAAVIAATEHALRLNYRRGDWLRKRLLQNVRRFREHLVQAGVSVGGGFFPVQTPRFGTLTRRIHTQLQAEGIETVLHHERDGHPAKLSFLITAAHSPQDIDYAAARVAAITKHSIPPSGNKVGNYGQVIGLYP